MAAPKRGVVERGMKRAGRARGDGGKLARLRLAVQEFVQAAGDQLPPPPQGSGKQSRRNRRDVRKEKRRLKRSRRRRLFRGEEPGEAPAAPASPAPALAARPAAPGSPPAAAQQQRPEPRRRQQKAARSPAPAPAAARSAAAAASARKRALLEANAAEEKEIRRLERRLGLGKRRRKAAGAAAAAAELPQSFVRDGLGYVLGALGSRATLAGLYASSDEEVGQGLGGEGRGPAEGSEGPEDEEVEEEDEGLEEEEPEEEDEGLEDEEKMEEDEGPEDEEELKDASDAMEGAEVGGLWESEGSGSLAPEREQSPGLSATKYVPPQVRKAQEAVDDKKREELGRLKKMVNGLINRLSEPNLSSISGQLEELYMANSRKDMNETLTDILMNACVTAVAMPTRLMMEHVLLVSILHHTVGIEVGAHFLEAVVKKFDEVYKSDAEGKECENLFALIAHLYNFHVVHSLLIFDILKRLVSTFTEKDIELILFLLKNVGFSLRRDDPLALKELISEAQGKANTVEKKLQDQTRVRFMLETMLALRNNDMRKIPGYDPEPVEKLRKLQRTLVHNSGSGKETQLRVSLESLLNADKVGRWWIVGSSWSGAPMIEDTNSKTQQKLHIGKEKTYNPFYAFLASKFCEYERRFQMTFQFSIWDKIRDLGNLSTTAVSNLISLLVHLLRTKSLPLSVLKVIEFSELDKPNVHFLRQVLSTLLIKTDAEDLSDIFGRISENPKLGMLREGLKLFLTHFLLKNVQAHKSGEEASFLKERVELASKALQAKESRLKL
ncbi:nucleolar MIF4G domain-containing protein 1 isoform X4 [Rhea pennata]|uniref:nucleolar MIF4G domain-containing protein 1 isoform X4 n=1 Tax=Rhea pennata TaxID=8795 RepID=UPI002E25D0D2